MSGVYIYFAPALCCVLALVYIRFHIRRIVYMTRTTYTYSATHSIPQDGDFYFHPNYTHLYDTYLLTLLAKSQKPFSVMTDASSTLQPRLVLTVRKH